MEIQKATIRQFKALPVEKYSDGLVDKRHTDNLIKTFSKGFVLDENIVSEYSDLQLAEIINIIKDEYGLTAEQMNASFHKSWAKIREASIEQLVLEQVIHYITTYGYEALGVYDESTVYIPNEKLDIPELKENIKLVIIKGYTKKELKKKLLNMLNSGIALKKQTKDDLVTIAKYVGMSTEEVEKVKNKEVKCELFRILKITPTNPIEFLRLLVYIHTGETLLIKSKDLINKIKEGKKEVSFPEGYSLEKLSEIFYRFKPIFLALRKVGYTKEINKIRNLARFYHKPMPEDPLNMVTARLKEGYIVDIDSLHKELGKVNIFRKIRLAYALKFRTTDADSILYRVRNGKSYAKEFEVNQGVKKNSGIVLREVLNSIVKDVSKNVEGKKIFMPDEMIYTLPATEKQFTGNLPTGSYVNIDSDMIVGINWHNIKGYRVDLDLSMQNAGGKMGWDSSYRNNERDMLFSGDITDACGKNGATELFYISKKLTEPYIMNVNYYNYDEKKPVPFKILVAKEKTTKTKFKENYMVDPNNVIGIAKSVVDKKQSVLGLVVPREEGNRFYFTETGIGSSISSGMDEYMEQARKFLLNNYQNSIELKEILERSGAEFVEDVEECDIDLSYDNLEKDTILNLLIKNKDVKDVTESKVDKIIFNAVKGIKKPSKEEIKIFEKWYGASIEDEVRRISKNK